jgi:hypothetical protein
VWESISGDIRFDVADLRAVLRFLSYYCKFCAKTAGSPPPLVLVGIGIAMTIGMPILYAVMGFTMGVIGAWFYNVIAKWIGGIQVEVE